MKFLRNLALHSLWAVLSLSLSALVLAGCLYFYMYLQLPDVATLKDMHLQVPLRIYTNDGKLIAEYGEKHRIPVKIEDVPKQLINAILVTEDNRYYDHPGVDFIGILRASKVLLLTGRKAQGASTITMQVARNFFLTREKTYIRKINEALLALKIESAFSKEKILELYLNKIYLGQRAYGVAAAAQVYYGKTLNQLTLPEMAMIAGLPRSPSTENPIRNPQAALERRNHVLERMIEAGLITRLAYEKAIAAPLDARLHGPRVAIQAPYVAEMVRQVMIDKFGEDAYTSGFSVYTTISSRLQEEANRSLIAGIIGYDKRHGLPIPYQQNGQWHVDHTPYVEGSLISISPQYGAILALTGGLSFELSHFNRVTQAQRQPGSSFKPFIYSAALEKGYTLASIVNDAPVVIPTLGAEKIWRPHNHTNKFYGPTRLRIGLSESRNLVSIRLLQQIGVSYALDYMSRFGFDEDQLPHALSLALGSGTVTPLQMAVGYSVFANGGHRLEPYFIDHITEHGKLLYQVKPLPISPHNQVISPENAYLMNNALQEVIKSGTGRAALSLKRNDLAGKTGTTNEQMDAWFAGYNPDVVSIVWIGYDQPQTLNEYGSQAALPIWIDFMHGALTGLPERYLPQPTDIVSARIDPHSGLLASPEQKNAVFELFTQQTIPTRKAFNSTESGGSGSNDSDDEESSGAGLF